CHPYLLATPGEYVDLKSGKFSRPDATLLLSQSTVVAREEGEPARGDQRRYRLCWLSAALVRLLPDWRHQRTRTRFHLWSRWNRQDHTRQDDAGDLRFLCA